MSDKFEISEKKISINIVKVISGLILLIAGIIVYKKNNKKNKYYSLASVLSGIFGVTILASELEEDFKPTDEDEEDV